MMSIARFLRTASRPSCRNGKSPSNHEDMTARPNNVSSPPRANQPLVLFALLACGVLLWFPDRLPIGYGDAGLLDAYYNPSYLWSLYRYVWNPALLAGSLMGQNLAALPTSALFMCLSAIGLPPFMRQALYFWLIQFVAMSSMYTYLRIVFRDHIHHVAISVCGALIYCYNPITMTNYWYNGVMTQSIVAFTPCALLTAELLHRLPRNAGLLLCGSVVTAFSIVFVNPAFALPIVILAASWWAFRVCQLSASRSDAVRRVAGGFVAVVTTSFIAAWFLLPLTRSLKVYYTFATGAEDPFSTLQASSSFSSTSTLMRLQLWDPSAGVWAYASPSWRFVYDHPSFIIIGVSIAGSMLVPLLYRRLDTRVYFFLVTLLLGFFFSLGLNQRTAVIFYWLFTHVPYFQAFRTPAGKFTPLIIVGASTLSSLGLTQLVSLVQGESARWIRKLASSMVLAIVCGLYTFPMWTGGVVDSPLRASGSFVSPSFLVPADYRVVADFLHSNGTYYRALALPFRPNVFVRMSWAAGYDGGDPTWLLLEYPMMASSRGGTPSTTALVQAYVDGGARGVVQASSILSVKYVVVQRDVDFVHGNYDGQVLESPMQVELELRREGLQEVLSAGLLHVYAMRPNATVPPVYISDVVVAWSRNLEGVHDSLFDSAGAFRGVAVGVLGQRDGPPLTSQNVSPYVPPSSVRYSELNPTHWNVDVDGATSPFLLVSTAAYDPSWHAYVSNTTDWPSDETSMVPSSYRWRYLPLDVRLLGHRDGEARVHWMVNGYANAWYIDPRSFGKHVHIVLYYAGQDVAYVGLAFSIVSAAAITILFLFASRRLVRPSRHRDH